MFVHCEVIDRFQNTNMNCRTRDVSLLSNLGLVLSVRIGYARFATCRPRGPCIRASYTVRPFPSLFRFKVNTIKPHT